MQGAWVSGMLGVQHTVPHIVMMMMVMMIIWRGIKSSVRHRNNKLYADHDVTGRVDIGG